MKIVVTFIPQTFCGSIMLWHSYHPSVCWRNGFCAISSSWILNAMILELIEVLDRFSPSLAVSMIRLTERGQRVSNCKIYIFFIQFECSFFLHYVHLLMTMKIFSPSFMVSKINSIAQSDEFSFSCTRKTPNMKHSC